MLNEIDLINTLKDRFKYSDRYVLIGVGDDCAVTKVGNNNLVLSTKDTVVEDVHFKLGNIDPSRIARKSVAVSVSDICAMGGNPKYFLSTIGIPEKTNEKFTDAIFDGFEQASQEFNVLLIGGNLTKSEKIFICKSINIFTNYCF